MEPFWSNLRSGRLLRSTLIGSFLSFSLIAVGPEGLSALWSQSCSGAELESGISTENDSRFLDTEGWRLAVEGDNSWSWNLDEVFLPKPEYKNEWWYFTGHLETGEGEWIGYQVTFFRIGLRPYKLRELSIESLESLAAPREGGSRWRANDVWMVHFAVSDIAKEKYSHDSRITRGAPGYVGWIPSARPDSASPSSPLYLKVGDWTLELKLPEATSDPVFWEMKLASKEVALDLTCDLTMATLQGGDGISQKADGAGRASYYFSYPRMPTRGTVRLSGKSESKSVKGWSWFDREVGSSQLSKNQLGWDWFAVQLDSGDCLMLYQMRTKSGKMDPNSHGAWIPASANRPLTRELWESKESWVQNETKELTAEDYRLIPGKSWSPADVTGVGSGYPVEWTVELPEFDLSLQVKAAFKEQEFGGAKGVIRYWEGAHKVQGNQQGSAINGKAYVEMTGYLGALEGLQGR
jgi:predicted secreted hydrolase